MGKGNKTLQKMDGEFDKPIEDIFFTPGYDPGMFSVGKVDWMWRAVKGGRIAAASVSVHAAHETEIDAGIATYYSRRAFKHPIEFNTIPVFARDVGFTKAFTSIKGKWLLSGAGGTRLRNQFSRKNFAERPDFDEQLGEYFAEIQERDIPVLPIMAKAPDKPTDLVLDCRNYFNFYHFSIETMPQICAFFDLPNPGRVRLHSPSNEVKGFVTALVDAHYPELEGRVDYIKAPAHYDAAYTVLNGRHYYHQTGPNQMPDMDAHAPQSIYFDGRNPGRIQQSVIAMNTFDANQRRMSERAIARVADMDTAHLPKRFWVAREASGPRVRNMLGEDELIEALAPRGFEVVYLERLSPMEQVALFYNAEIMMSYHGAGFANMLYAGPDTYCIELGNIHSCLFRWQDFTCLAHVSGCRYVNLFADINQDDPSVVPPDMRSAPVRPVALFPEGQNKVLRLVDSILGATATTGTHKELTDLAKLLNQCQAWAPLRDLIAAHVPLFETNVEGLMHKANALEGLGETQAAFDAVDAAWIQDRARPFTLERLALMAVVHDGSRAEALCTLHAEQFPDRHPAFLKRFRRAQTLRA